MPSKLGSLQSPFFLLSLQFPSLPPANPHISDLFTSMLPTTTILSSLSSSPLSLSYHFFLFISITILLSFLRFPFLNPLELFSPQLGGIRMTLKGGTSQACAACKYQRRKCSGECPLAPYFPPDQPKMFQNAHRLFGVSNILKILKQLDPGQKMEAMRSIIYQANIRDRFPVHGCCGVIGQLQYQIRLVEEEFQAVLSQLALYRHQHQQQHEIQHHEISCNPNDSTSQLQPGMGPPSNNALSLFHQDTPQPVALPISSYQSYPNCNNVIYNSGFVDKEHVLNSFWVQHQYSSDNNNNNNNNNSMAMQSQLVSSQELTIQQELAQEYDEMHPFFDTIDDRQSYIDSKEAYDSSSDSSLKDTTQSIEHVADDELKSAAACFSLTSVN